MSTTRANSTDMLDQRMIKAVGHPLRMRLLTLLNQKVASPNELSQELGEPLGTVAYHVRILLDLGAIELVRETPRRGAIEHHYRALMRPWFRQRDWGQLPVSARQTVSESLLSQVWSDTVAALEAGTFDARADRHLSRTALSLDEQGWSEIAELFNETLEKVVEIQTRAADRLADDEAGDAVSGEAVMMHFEVPEQRGADGS